MIFCIIELSLYYSRLSNRRLLAAAISERQEPGRYLTDRFSREPRKVDVADAMTARLEKLDTGVVWRLVRVGPKPAQAGSNTGMLRLDVALSETSGVA